jgi:putative ABC transport system permease protein
MIFNYIKIAYRNLLRRKGFAAINIAGLSIGIASCILLFVVVTYELSFDKFQKNYDRIFRVVTKERSVEENFTTGVPFPAVETFRMNFPDAVTAGLYSRNGSQVTVVGEDSTNTRPVKKFIEDHGVFFAEPEVFSIFTVKFLSGSGGKLNEPNQVVISRSLAEKYFGRWEDAVGQFVRLDLNILLNVAGVIEDAPSHSDFPFKLLASFKTLKQHGDSYGYSTHWGANNSDMQLYMLLPGSTSAGIVESKINSLTKEFYRQVNDKNTRTHVVQPLSDIHFDTRYGNFNNRMVSRPTIWTLVLVGLMIIVMACINFINLSTAQSVSRSKEVGLRKVLGGSKAQLIGQFFSETSIIVGISMAFGLGIAYLASPQLDNFVPVGKDVNIISVPTMIFLLITAVVVVLLSGFYPAMILSGFKPALALKNKISSASIGNISLRRGLVVLQFALSQLLIIGTIVAISQMNYIRNADLGLKKDAVLVVTHSSDSASIARMPAFKNELLRIKGIEAVSFSSDVPTSDNNWSTNFAFNGGEDEKFGMFIKVADQDYLDAYGISIIAGRGLSKSDTMKEFVVNETLVKKLGIRDPSEIVGKNIRLGTSAWLPVVGVVKDFKTNSLREDIKPLAIFSRNNYYSSAGIKLSGANFTDVVATVQRTWDKYFPEYVNNSRFMDEAIAEFYTQEEQLSRLYKIFAVLAIIISCLGLYGLVSFMAAQKTREVGIRKVLGASTASIVFLFSKEFMLLILVAFLIASPLAIMFMNNWLSNFTFRVDIGPGVFLVAIVTTLAIAWITVGLKAFRAARVNPTESLKSE